jgi:hypothetical protein
MKLLIFSIFLLSFTACDRNDQAGATGSGAGLYEERQDGEKRQDATGGEDMNITTPIDEREEN